ncbi:HAD-IIA family hydrolase [Brevibacterium litoralis]|uniref:HAD-IIA family hydrolase n=1 Tax=Brevibacterium litoralis TaxID=3138935 RepID=UPI0032EE5431
MTTAAEGTGARAFDSVLLDLDGVVYAGPHAVPGVPEALGTWADRGVPYGFVTNNAGRSAATVAAHLRELGLRAEEDQVVTSAAVCARALAAEVPAGSRVLVVGAESLVAELRAAGLDPVRKAADDPVAVVQGFHRGVDWEELAEACVAIRAGAAWWVTNLDPTVPTERGLLPGNGAFVSVVRSTTGATYRATGKPDAAMLHHGARSIGGERPLMVGDRLDTDIQGAVAAGYDSALVLTGVHDLHDALRAPAHMRPGRVVRTLTDLLEPMPVPHVFDSFAAACNGVAVRIDGRRLVTDEPGLDAANAALALLATLPSATDLDLSAFPARPD